MINTTAKANKPTILPFAREVPLIIVSDDVLRGLLTNLASAGGLNTELLCDRKDRIIPFRFLKFSLLASVV